MDFETTFKDNQRILGSLSHLYSLKCGNMIAIEDFYSQGCELFIKCFNKYDPERAAKFSTYFYSSCKGFFQGMVIKETIRRYNHTSPREISVNQPTPERKVSFIDAISKMSTDAIEVIMLVFKTPSDFIDGIGRKTIRSYLMKKWRGEGAQNRIKYAFDEIRETLNDF